MNLIEMFFGKKLYIVHLNDSEDIDRVGGVFDTREKANSFIASHGQETWGGLFHGAFWEIVECRLNVGICPTKRDKVVDDMITRFENE